MLLEGYTRARTSRVKRKIVYANCFYLGGCTKNLTLTLETFSRTEFTVKLNYVRQHACPKKEIRRSEDNFVTE